MYKYGVLFKIVLIAGLLLLAGVAAYSFANRGPKLPPDLSGALETATLHYGLPGMVACTLTVDDIEVAAYGSRALDASFRVHGRGALDHARVEDFWHLGSNTKAITATLAAILWEEGGLKEDEKLTDVFDFDLHSDYANVTLHDLFEHRGGIAAYTAGAEFDQVPESVSTGTPLEQRLKFSKWLLAQPAAHEHGDHVYSNAGYGVAAAVLEAKTGQSWEALLQAKLLEPLGVKARFGWPATPDDSEQPRGHRDEGKGLVPLAVDHDYALPAAIDPAGDLSMPIGDYARFLQLHLRGLRGLETLDNSGKAILKPATIKQLHTPRNGNYSCGWIETRTLGLQESSHDGSTGTFYCTATIDASSDFAVAVMTNAGGDAATAATHAVANRLIAAMITRSLATGVQANPK
jgi:D-alanyl-D-alanine carboxypeptidase